ncbi:MAG: hypothetical protein WC464_03665 [Bdellovibrionales bacterium]
MKLSSLFAAAFVACLAFAQPASAATVEISTASDPSAYPDSGIRTVSGGTYTTWDNVVGYLAPYSAITISYTAENVYKMILNVSGLDEDVNYIVAAASSMNDSTGFTLTSSTTITSATAPLISATASLYPLSGTAVIANNSNAVVSFNSDFGISFMDYVSGDFTVAYSVSSIPLPSAIVLFAPALAGLAGFAKRKRA